MVKLDDRWGAAQVEVSSCLKKEFECLCQGSHKVKVPLRLWVGGCSYDHILPILRADRVEGLVPVDHCTKHHRLQQRNKCTVLLKNTNLSCFSEL